MVMKKTVGDGAVRGRRSGSSGSGCDNLFMLAETGVTVKECNRYFCRHSAPATCFSTVVKKKEAFLKIHHSLFHHPRSSTKSRKSSSLKRRRHRRPSPPTAANFPPLNDASEPARRPWSVRITSGKLCFVRCTFSVDARKAEVGGIPMEISSNISTLTHHEEHSVQISSTNTCCFSDLDLSLRL